MSEQAKDTTLAMLCLVVAAWWMDGLTALEVLGFAVASITLRVIGDLIAKSRERTYRLENGDTITVTPPRGTPPEVVDAMAERMARASGTRLRP